jgi:hypothetical protein
MERGALVWNYDQDDFVMGHEEGLAKFLKLQIFDEKNLI